MNRDSKEHLSQLMDGEIGGETGRFVLRRLEASGELRGTWARYHLIRDCMRYQDRGFADDELCNRVWQGIENAPEDTGLSAQHQRSWLRPVTGFAVAAGVALMAVVAVAPNLSTTEGFGTEQAASVTSQPFASPNILSRDPGSRQVNLNGQTSPDTRKMDSYLLRHYQVAGSSAGNGFVSFVPIVTGKPTVKSTQQADEAGQLQRESEVGQEQP